VNLRRLILAATLLIAAASAPAQQVRPNITTPKQSFGFNIGDDYHLANYVQLTAYWQKLASESDRMKLVEMGKTSEGRPQWMAIISSPENIKNLDHYRDISHKLALAKGLTDDQAHALAKEGKAVVWIDGGLRFAADLRTRLRDERLHRRRDDALPQGQHPARRL
jgi:ABC-type glycerol-3-phosphate transport system substrate-binding protein